MQSRVFSKIKSPENVGVAVRRFANLMPKSVRIVEVGPRDGLQNEKVIGIPLYTIRMGV